MQFDANYMFREDSKLFAININPIPVDLTFLNMIGGEKENNRIKQIVVK